MTNPYLPPQLQPTVITDIRIPFWRLVAIFIKWTFAAIPATIFVLLVIGLIVGVVGAFFQGLIPNLQTLPIFGR